MILEIYDKVTRERIDIIRSYSFVQYNDYFNDIGTFTLTIPIVEKSLRNLLVDGNYILFEKDIMGIIKYFKKESVSSTTVTIKGFLLNQILTRRYFLLTTKYTGKVFEIERNIVNDMFISSDDVRRNIDYLVLSDTYPDSEQTSLQNTGNSAAEEIQYLNNLYGYGYDLVPKIQKYNEAQDKLTNIESFIFVNRVPVNRTIGNSDGNNPVVFATSLNNLSDIIYESDNTEFCSIAIVAGEDSGQDRKVVEVGDTNSSGIDRIEMYVDARDIQSEDSEGQSIPEQDYLNLLRKRGLEKLNDNTSYVTFDGTVIVNSNNSYEYGVDFFKGDYVTILDEQLGIRVDLQITGITKSLTEKGEFIDVMFGQPKKSMYKMIRENGGNR